MRNLTIHTLILLILVFFLWIEGRSAQGKSRIGLTIRPFSGIGTTFVNLEDYANSGANVHPLQVVEVRPGLQVIHDLNEDLGLGVEAGYLPLYSIDNLGGSSLNLEAALFKIGFFGELNISNIMIHQLGVGLYVNMDDDIPNKLTDDLNFSLMYSMGPQIELSKLVTLNPMIKFDFIFAEQFTVAFTMAIGLSFTL